MKIDRVIFAWDGNPNYAGLYELQRKVWGKLGIKTSLMWVSDEPCPIEGDDVHKLHPSSDLKHDTYPKRNWQAPMGILWGLTLFGNETVMSSGIDQIPLSRRFIGVIEPLGDENIVIGLAGVGYEYPSSHVVGKSCMFKSIFGSSSFKHMLNQAYECIYSVQWEAVSHKWGIDEEWLAVCLMESGVTPTTLSKEFFDKWDSDRIGRNREHYSMDTLENLYYSELHCSSPPSDYDKHVIMMIQDFL